MVAPEQKESQGATAVSLPPAPLPERIVIYMDTSADIAKAKLQLHDHEELNSFERLQKIIRMYVMNKVGASCNGSQFCQFAIMAYLGDSFALLEGGQFQEGKNAVANLSDQIRMQDVNESGTSSQAASSVPPLDLGEAIRTVASEIYVYHPAGTDAAGSDDRPPVHLTRLIMFITRTRSTLKLEPSEDLKRILENPYFTTDVVYLHENPTDDNFVQHNWSIISELNDLQNQRGYMFECAPDVTDWHNAAAILLPSPLVRVPLSQVQSRKRGKKAIGDTAGDQEVMEVEPTSADRDAQIVE